VTPYQRTPSIFAWLDEVRARPGMFVGGAERPLDVLESMVWGYYTALSTRGIVELVPEMKRHFSDWLHHRTSWSVSRGWADAIASHAQKRPHLALFFDLVDEYRGLVPVTVLRAPILRSNANSLPYPGWSLSPPRHVELVRYAPTRFYFLRFVGARWNHNADILATNEGSRETSSAFAKRYASEHLGVVPKSWVRTVNSRLTHALRRTANEK
jgi:hypothetical protein